MKRVIGASAIVALLMAGWIAMLTQSRDLVWDHFDEVKPGVLYRSGQLDAEQLSDAVRAYGIRTVVSFQVAGLGVETERALARSLGVGFVNLPMPGDGSGREAQFREILKLLEDPEHRPAIVHCARGTCRTGASVGLYRLEVDGWTIEDVAAEMRRQAYREGWLPGYVYGMVRERPFDERYQPPIRSDFPDAAGPRRDPHASAALDRPAHRH